MPVEGLKRQLQRQAKRELNRKLTGASKKRGRKGAQRSRGRSFSWLLLVLLLLGGGGYYWLETGLREKQAFAGVPEIQNWRNWQSWHRVLRNEGFMLGYSEWRMNPLWVTYRLEAVTPGASGSRPSRFSADTRTLPFWQVSHDDYTHSGYDRGHLAPNYAIAKVHGREAQLQTFLMTNISPQTPDLNRQLWQRLEESAMDHFAPLKGETWVITGPVFGDAVERLSSSWKVQIPEAFYKIFIAPPKGDRPLKVLAFLMPQSVRGNEPLDQFLVSVREIEALTGLDFMHQLPDELENQVETSVNPEPWQLSAVSRKPGRFQ